MADKICAFPQSADNEVIREPDTVMYDTKDIARIMGCSVPTAREIMHRADFPLISIGKILRVSKPAFEKWTMEKRM